MLYEATPASSAGAGSAALARHGRKCALTSGAMTTEVVIGLTGILSTLAAGLGGIVLQSRAERAKWRREERAKLYILLAADASQRQTPPVATLRPHRCAP